MPARPRQPNFQHFWIFNLLARLVSHRGFMVSPTLTHGYQEHTQILVHTKLLCRAFPSTQPTHAAVSNHGTPQRSIFELALGWVWRSGVLWRMTMISCHCFPSLRGGGKGAREGSCLRAHLPVPGGSSTNNFCKLGSTPKGRETSGFPPPEWFLGFRLAAHWGRGWILRPQQQRRAQHLHPHHLPSPFAQLQPCNPDSEDGLRKAKPPSTLQESFPCCCFVSPSAGAEQPITRCPPGLISTHCSPSSTFPSGHPGTLQDAFALIPRHSLAQITPFWALGCPRGPALSLRLAPSPHPPPEPCVLFKPFITPKPCFTQSLDVHIPDRSLSPCHCPQYSPGFAAGTCSPPPLGGALCCPCPCAPSLLSMRVINKA